MARVNVEPKALSDPRFVLLGQLIGSNRHEALGRMVLVWNECTERNAYTLPDWLLRALLGHANAGDLLVESELAERNHTTGEIRIRGTEGRTEWLEEKRETAKAGGRKRAETAKRGPGGKFLPTSGPAPNQPEDQPPDQHPAGESPEKSSAPALALSPALAPTPAKDESPLPSGESPAGKPPTALSPDGLASIWNENRGQLAAIRTPIGSARRKKVQARLKEFPSAHFWTEVVQRFALNPRAGTDDGAWMTFDHLLRNDTNADRILEGAWDKDFGGGNGKSQATPGPPVDPEWQKQLDDKLERDRRRQAEGAA